MTNAHNDRCASLLGQGCDCRSPWPDDDPPTSDNTGQQDRIQGSAATIEVARWRGCCRHPKDSHDQHGCTVDVSTDRRCYYRCHDDDQPALDPRWRDYHTLPDEWVLRPIQKWFYRRKRVRPDGTVQYPFRLRWLVILLSRYSLRHFHCPKDGQCIFRAKHRGSCCWGNDDDD